MKEKINNLKKFKISKVVILVIISFALFLALVAQTFMNRSCNVEVINPYEITTKANDNFVFLGDSITDFYPLEEFFDDLPVINSGISGNSTDDILNELNDRVIRYNPTKVFLLIGTNDIEYGKKNDEIISNIKIIVKNILKKRPNTKIYIESVYPINNSDDDKIDHGMVGKRDNKTIINLNKKIKKYCEKNDYTYINMYDELLDKDGNLDLKYTKEGLHMSNLGYVKITKVLYKYLND